MTPGALLPPNMGNQRGMERAAPTGITTIAVDTATHGFLLVPNPTSITQPGYISDDLRPPEMNTDKVHTLEERESSYFSYGPWKQRCGPHTTAKVVRLVVVLTWEERDLHHARFLPPHH
jgi:hypothetical protein